MAQKSSIQWTDATWNVARGCTKVDEDCKFCYMYRDSFNNTRYNPLEVVRTKTVFNLPLKIKEPSKIFTCSLTDFFHEAIDGYRNECWDIIRKCPHHTFQILTKRPERIKDHLPADWGDGWDNVWLGTSCGSQASADIRIPELLKVKSKTIFLSLEPLWGEIKLTSQCCLGCGRDIYKNSCSCPAGTGTYFVYYPHVINKRTHWGIDWVIVGGESGNETGKYRYRPCELSWLNNIVSDCKQATIPVFVKQLGTHLAKKLKLNNRHGGNIDEFPEHLRIREFPNITKS
jgi:protein gp37